MDRAFQKFTAEEERLDKFRKDLARRRRNYVLGLRQSGLSPKLISERLGLTVPRVHQLINAACKGLKIDPAKLPPLKPKPPRIAAVKRLSESDLERFPPDISRHLGPRSMRALVTLFPFGPITPQIVLQGTSFAEITKMPGYGRKTAGEIREWVSDSLSPPAFL